MWNFIQIFVHDCPILQKVAILSGDCSKKIWTIVEKYLHKISHNFTKYVTPSKKLPFFKKTSWQSLTLQMSCHSLQRFCPLRNPSKSCGSPVSYNSRGVLHPLSAQWEHPRPNSGVARRRPPGSGQGLTRGAAERPMGGIGGPIEGPWGGPWGAQASLLVM